jgi:hypothetical protein
MNSPNKEDEIEHKLNPFKEMGDVMLQNESNAEKPLDFK